MQNQIINQSFEGSEIRITKVNDVVYFVGKDVAEVLEYSNNRDAIANHVWDEYKADVAISDGSQARNMVCITEQGVYQLVFGSKKPEARKFQRWIIEDVLPSINQTGGYSIQQVQPVGLTSAEMFMRSAQLMYQHEQQIKHLEQQVVSQTKTIQVIESRTEKFEIPEGYETVSSYLDTLSTCSVSNGRGKATQRIGSYLNNNGYSKHSSKVYDTKAGYEVNAWQIGAVEDAIRSLITDADLIVYQGHKGKPQVKTFKEVQQVKRIKKRFTPTEALTLVFS